MEPPRLYEEFAFWKQSYECNSWPWDIYEDLKRGITPPGVESLPCADIVDRLREAFPNCVGRGDQLLCEPEGGGSFKISPARFRFSVNLLGVSNTDKNTILDIFEQFECPPYDVRLAERYGLQGMINRDFSWQYTHARFDYLRDERKPSGQVVYEPSWEDSNYVWERELWDEVYASYLPSSPDNSASYPGDQMNSDLQVIVTDRQSIEEGIVVESAYVVISISDPGSRQPRVRRSAGFRGVLHLEFHDAEPMENGDAPRDIQLMTVEQAKAVWSFVTQHQDKVGAIVCHCEQGMSRSPAVAAALAVEFNCDLAEVVGYRQPNRYVFELIRSMLDAERTRRA